MSDISYPVGETDYISSLHDTILCHILSFLPTKSTVKTCVLSKRWKKVWNQVPVLDFTEIPDGYHPLCNEAKISYNKFVNKVLAENNAFYLQRFCYEFSCDDDCDYYESWLNAAKKREYYEIDLNFTLGGSRSYKFIEMIYGKGVKMLKLTGVKMNDTPESFHLPSLEIVHFVRVEFNGSEYMKRFTSNCATLKTIIIKECTGFDEMLFVESLTLKSLEIFDIVSQAWGRSLIISIKAPILEYLSIDDEITYYMVDSLALLTEANLNLRENFPVMVNEHGSDYDIYQNINYLISKASKVRSLRLKTSGVEWIDTSLNCIAEEGCLSNLKACNNLLGQRVSRIFLYVYYTTMEIEEEVELAIEKYKRFCRIHKRILEVLKLNALEMQREVLCRQAEVDRILKDASEGSQSAIGEAPTVVVNYITFLNQLKSVTADGIAQINRLKEDKQKEREKLESVVLKYNRQVIYKHP
ncbi:F-box/LRR-repeat protein 13-like [Chenopodium quinoa]|uniref:F-box/LRR-repeat protein 13-like n=1 Tax=Chenopodium quinoa TaxID=63459 RepID=UPI000B76D917|nr:F-box/LRR-repeat protein 13-like [Chenopodium quinoa]